MSKKPEDILRTAEQFRRAAILLERDASSELVDTIFPHVVSSAFALELYLKFLIQVTSGEIVHGHDLRKLFDSPKLPQHVRDAIRHKWDNPLPPALALRKATEKRTGHNWPSFDESLDTGAVAFVKWRYAHEDYEGLEGWTAGEIMENARRVIFDMYPYQYRAVRLGLPKGMKSAAFAGPPQMHATPKFR